MSHPVRIELKVLVEFTDWERAQWRTWFEQHGDSPLEIAAGPHGDGRFEKVGDLIKHIFSAEKRYVERLTGRPLTDPGAIPSGPADALFEFGRLSRQDLRDFIEALAEDAWDKPFEFKVLDYQVNATPKKVVMHVLMHEIRHWAQIFTLLRLNGLKGEFHDFLFSPILGGGVGGGSK
jgi:uncharacterized damage-inducible protein DinB